MQGNVVHFTGLASFHLGESRGRVSSYVFVNKTEAVQKHKSAKVQNTIATYTQTHIQLRRNACTRVEPVQLIP